MNKEVQVMDETIYFSPYGVRVQYEPNKKTVWFNAEDVCRCLEFSSTAIAVAENVYGFDNISIRKEGDKSELYIDEDGIYFLCFASRSDSVSAFKLSIDKFRRDVKRV